MSRISALRGAPRLLSHSSGVDLGAAAVRGTPVGKPLGRRQRSFFEPAMQGSALLGGLLNEVLRPRAREADILERLVAVRHKTSRDVDAFVVQALGRVLAQVIEGSGRGAAGFRFACVFSAPSAPHLLVCASLTRALDGADCGSGLERAREAHRGGV